MIVTLTAHPSLDRTVALPAALRAGEVQTATGVREDAGGKGVNVSRVVAASGSATLAVVPLAPGDPYGAALASAGIAVATVPVHGAARANIALTDPDGVTTKVNLPGAALDAVDLDALVAAVVDAVDGASWLVLAGSLAPGMPDDFYVRVIRAVRQRHGERAPRFAVDTSGAALRAVVDRGRPDLIKPNDDELRELAGEAEAPSDLDGVARLAQTLVPARVGAALVTLGADGALLATADGLWHAAPPPTRVRSTVGAGDSSLAGYLLAATAASTPDEYLRNAVRYGSAAASLPGTAAPTPADLAPDDIAVRAMHH